MKQSKRKETEEDGQKGQERQRNPENVTNWKGQNQTNADSPKGLQTEGKRESMCISFLFAAATNYHKLLFEICETTHVYYLTVLWFKSLKWVLLGQNQGSFLETTPLPSPSSRGCPLPLLMATSLSLQSQQCQAKYFSCALSLVVLFSFCPSLFRTLAITLDPLG